MKQKQNASYHLRTSSRREKINRQRQDVNRDRVVFTSTIPPLHILFRQILRGLKRWLNAIRYQLSRLVPARIKLPWFQVALALLFVFVLFKRDLQFQVNLHAPGTALTDDTRARTENTSQFSAAEAIPTRADRPIPKKRPNPFLEAPDDSEKDRRVKAYVRRFAKVAQTESKKFGIPASIKMAQALVESNAGSSRLARRNNNHFGIKCFSRSCGKGHCSNFSDDHHKDFFRIYDSAWESWRAHSQLLSGKKYKALKKHGKDYRAWAAGLKSVGYATDPTYPQKLVKTIETYELDYLDE